MISLRQWQSECVNFALEHYKKGHKNFLCLATPGAGKSIMAAEIASRLFDKGTIEFVICFSPSTAISRGLARTFKERLNVRFDGVIGALGASYTYQSLPFIDESFWMLLKEHNVLVVFDEIHHCAGLNVLEANAWGKAIIEHIQLNARYTLSLTGTPWRSDKVPISLSSYEDNEIECDYIYGLSQAIKDSVCRMPSIVLVDNDQITATFGESEVRHFSSISDYLDEPSTRYQNVITDDTCIKYLIKLGVKKLKSIQVKKQNAAGLIVASSIGHAQRIHTVLANDFNINAVIVTYKHSDPVGIIDDFRNSDTDWIVSVGMISEGTDIPRLQVCCHLSRVRTELYFRQVLGRILRVNPGENQEAWLFTFAEPNLTKYANRIAKEVPEQNILLREQMPSIKQALKSRVEAQYPNDVQVQESFESGSWATPKHTYDEEKIMSLVSCNQERNHNDYFEIVGDFRQQIVEAFCR